MNDLMTGSLEALGGAAAAAEGTVSVIADTVADVLADPRRRRRWLWILVIAGAALGGVLVAKKMRGSKREPQPLG